MPQNPRLLRPRASSGFLPSTISGLELWLDASQTSTVTLNGSTVSEWRDRRSSSTAKVVQATAASQPTWVASSKNGYGGVSFPANRELRSSTFNYSQPTTYFAVFRTPSTNTGVWQIMDGLTTRQHVYGTANTSFRMFAGSDTFATTVAGDTFYAAILVYNGSSSSRRLNTKTATTGNPGTNAINDLVLRGNENVLNEFGMFSKAVSDTEAGQLLDYLSKKWAITLT